MDKLSRFAQIDILRGIAIIAMILIHVNYFYISDKIAFILWNYSQFAVPVFIFCSSYLFFVKKREDFGFNYFKKRILRLMIPYWVFLVAFIPLVFLNETGKVSFSYVLNSIFAIGGVDISWLVLLFLFFSILFPVISYLLSKQKLLFGLFCFAVFLFSLITMFVQFQVNYRFIMWIPWSVIVLFSILFLKFQNKKRFYPIVLAISFILFALLLFVQQNQNHSLSLVNNKYPPNLYFLMFGIFFIALLFWLARLNMFKCLKKGLLFLSVNSYSIYFIHYAVLYLARIYLKNFSWASLFLVVFVFTILVQVSINRLSLLRR